jgi:hypothetical protein
MKKIIGQGKKRSHGKKSLLLCSTISSPWLIRMQHSINLRPPQALGFKKKKNISAMVLKVFQNYTEIIFT